jgi:hypothetical protein
MRRSFRTLFVRLFQVSRGCTPGWYATPRWGGKYHRQGKPSARFSQRSGDIRIPAPAAYGLPRRATPQRGGGIRRHTVSRAGQRPNGAAAYGGIPCPAQGDAPTGGGIRRHTVSRAGRRPNWRRHTAAYRVPRRATPQRGGGIRRHTVSRAGRRPNGAAAYGGIRSTAQGDAPTGRRHTAAYRVPRRATPLRGGGIPAQGNALGIARRRIAAF